MNFRNCEHFKQLIDNIKNGIFENNWGKSEFIKFSGIKNIDVVIYTIYYRDMIKVLKHLIGHEPFVDNFTYIPVRNYNTDDFQERTRYDR